jgi:hypothetical protein
MVAGSGSLTGLTSMVRVLFQAEETSLTLICSCILALSIRLWLGYLAMLDNQGLLISCLGHSDWGLEMFGESMK